MKAALCQFDMKWEDKAHNIVKAEKFVEEKLLLSTKIYVTIYDTLLKII